MTYALGTQLCATSGGDTNTGESTISVSEALTVEVFLHINFAQELSCEERHRA